MVAWCPCRQSPPQQRISRHETESATTMSTALAPPCSHAEVAAKHMHFACMVTYSHAGLYKAFRSVDKEWCTKVEREFGHDSLHCR
jgi:hypothetical protein